MATTSIPTSRKSGSALEKFRDALFVRDDIKLYFGDGGDASLHWDGTNLKISGSNILIVDLPAANPGVSDALYVSDAGGTEVRASTGQ